MTMLDTMRRHRGWLKWSLALVVLAFIAFYVPDFIGGGPGSGPAALSDELARVGDRRVTVADFQRAYRAQVQMYRNAYGGSMNDSLLRQLGIDRQIVQQLVDEQAALAEAQRLGLTASDAEVRERVLGLPVFQENGQFVGEDRYRLILRSQNPPLDPRAFEESMRQSILLEKLRDAITGWVTVTDEELDTVYRTRNEKVKVQLVSLPSTSFSSGLVASDAEAAAYFESHEPDFTIGEKKKVKYALIDVQAMRDRVVVSEQDVERNYRQNEPQYTTPEQVRASHILLKTEGKDEAAVRAQAEKVLTLAKAPGADFSALATQYSEDEGSKTKGGDLDYFGRGSMVPEFEQVAFTLAPGTMSDLVKTAYGFHVIKVVDKRAGGIKPLAEVAPQITEQIKWERAQAQAATLSTTIAGQIANAADLDRVAKANGLTAAESDFFLRNEPITGIGPSPEPAAAAFTLKEGEASGPIRVPQGWVLLVPTATQASRVPALNEVADKVKLAVVGEKALAAARARGAALAAALAGASDFMAVAKAQGFEAKSTELVTRNSAYPDAGISPAIDAAAFALPVGGTSQAISTPTGVVIVKVVERTDVTAEQARTARDTLRGEVLTERRGRFFSSYMAKVKDKLKITIDREMVERAIA